ncbi:MAG: preprotein translocase subunit SecE [Acholeplasma sp.]|jgi:preprotein translocase subunit SecE|nr:preprotein translocase subunit SecE [Acholeplasma sp.]
MAVKAKATEKKSKVVEILTTDYPWENLLLGILASLSLALSIMILGGILTTEDGPIPIISDYPNLFAGILLGISIVGLLLVIYPFFVPALPELKKMSWASWSTYLDASVRVLIFVIFFALVFFAYDLLLAELSGRLFTR